MKAEKTVLKKVNSTNPTVAMCHYKNFDFGAIGIELFAAASKANVDLFTSIFDLSMFEHVLKTLDTGRKSCYICFTENGMYWEMLGFGGHRRDKYRVSDSIYRLEIRRDNLNWFTLRLYKVKCEII